MVASRTPVRGTSLAVQVLDILIERIREGIYPPESQLPAENELAAEFGVSRATVRSAISALAARGLVVRRQGVGTFVSRLSRLSNPLNEANDFHGMITAQGFQCDVEFIQAAVVPAGARVAEALQIPPDAPVLQNYKLFTADGAAAIYCLNHLPMALLEESGVAQEVLLNPHIIEPLYDFLERRCHQRIEYHIATFRADIVGNLHFPGLDLDPTTPVLIIEEVGYNAAERPIWHSYEYYPGNVMTFRLIRRRAR